MPLDDLRRQIDKIDHEIIALLDKRFGLAREVATVKFREGSPLHHPTREKEVLEKVLSLSQGGIPGQSLKDIYRLIMAESLALQKSLAPATEKPCPSSRKADLEAVIADNREIAPGFFRMRVNSPLLTGLFKPGQFFQFQIGETGAAPLLRRPFAPSEFHAGGISFVYAIVGDGTQAMTRLKPGDRAHLLAPLGNGFTVSPLPAIAILVGGGCGGPSLKTLAAALKRDGAKTIVILGARSACSLLEKSSFAELVDKLIIATDDGTDGVKGTAVTALEKELADSGETPDRLYACGPTPMLKALASWATGKKVPCEVSLEERMACGFGACMGCAVAVKTPEGSVFRRVCAEGPVFDAMQLAW